MVIHMNKLLNIILAMALLAALTSCVNHAPPTATELLDLGEKHLLELNYEQAIVYLLAFIEIEPKNEKAYILLADAYKQSGSADKGQSVLEMGFALLYDNTLILENLLDSMIDNSDAEAVGRLVADVQRIGNLKAGGFENSLQKLINTENTAFIERLISVLYKQDSNSALALGLELWLVTNNDYSTDDERNDAINKLLIDRELSIPKLRAGDEFYLGDYDDEGKRQGFGIVFYGEGVKIDSTMYIGYWENDVRNGEGTAYNGVYYYIKGNWAEDLPDGQMMARLTSGHTSEGLYVGGAGQGEMMHYYDDGLVQVHNIWVDGVRYLRAVDDTELSRCNHTYHWDVEYVEGDN